MTTRASVCCVGTNIGQIFATNNADESWSLIADFLPLVYSVTAAVIAWLAIETAPGGPTAAKSACAD